MNSLRAVECSPSAAMTTSGLLATARVHDRRAVGELLVAGHRHVRDQVHARAPAGPQQRAVQVAAVDDHVGEAVALLDVGEVEAGQLGAVDGVAHDQVPRPHAERLHLVAAAPRRPGSGCSSARSAGRRRPRRTRPSARGPSPAGPCGRARGRWRDRRCRRRRRSTSASVHASIWGAPSSSSQPRHARSGAGRRGRPVSQAGQWRAPLRSGGRAWRTTSAASAAQEVGGQVGEGDARVEVDGVDQRPRGPASTGSRSPARCGPGR